MVFHHMDALVVRGYASAGEGIVNADIIGFSHRSWTNTRLLVCQRDDFLELVPITMVAVQPHGLGGNMQRLLGLPIENVTIDGSYNMAIDILQVINQRWHRRAKPHPWEKAAEPITSTPAGITTVFRMR